MLPVTAASIIALFSFFSFELALTNSFTAPECSAACLSHSQAGPVLTNLDKLKKNDNEPRPPAYPQYDRTLIAPLLVVGLSVVIIGWLNWYSRKMLISTQLRY